jgi:mycothiol synthase
VSGTLADRPYVDGDLPLLQSAMAGWRREVGLCGYCHVGDLPHRIYGGLRGRHPVGDLVRIWEDSAGVAGIAVALRFGLAFDAFMPHTCGGPKPNSTRSDGPTEPPASTWIAPVTRTGPS